jgi:nitrite reductase/ring-hydroxylating ferredoxin subunit
MASLQPAAARGRWRTCAPGAVEGTELLHRRVITSIVDAVAEIKGQAAANQLRSAGVEMLHAAIDPLDIGPLRDRVLEPLRNDLLRTAVRVGRSVMEWPAEFYVDDYLILRISLPYEVAKHADRRAENPGVGRVSPAKREALAARRVNDPLYDPRAYHRSQPPAAWAHGPHLDSWTGHSRDGVNVWWAICDVPAEAGVVLYPAVDGEALRCDRTSLYLRAGYALPPPTYVPLAAGEMLVFDPEMLHGTHLNVTNRTRIAVSLRLNAHKPAFDPDCFYAREFWRRASDIEAGEFDDVLHLQREANLADRTTARQAAPRVVPTVVDVPVAEGSRFVAIGPSSLVREGQRIVAALPDQRVMLGRRSGALFAVDANCPHYGLDLADGGARGTTVYCPGCAVGFDVITGRSAAPSLALTTFTVRERGGTIVLDRLA